MDKKKFGLFIKESRLKKGLTQQELANQLYLDVTAISKWERGVSYPDITMIPEICQALDVNEHELIESSQDTEYRRMKKDASIYNKTKNAIFFISSLMYSIAIITCFIVNLAVDKTLSWFFIVLTGCLTGFTFIPTILRFFETKKLIIFIGSTFASLFLLYLTCSIYNNNYWFMIATIGTLMGYFAFFVPVLFAKQKCYLKEEQYQNLKRFFPLIYIVTLCVLTVFLEISINYYHQFDLSKGLLITLYSYSIAILCSALCLIKMSRIRRAGICFILISLYSLTINPILSNLLEVEKSDLSIDLLDWVNHTSGNVALIVFASLLVVGILFIVLGKKKIKIEK